ncbi:MAG: hypothetical protein ACRC7O_11310, partial [Fimbriiglobus sp.]
DPEAVRELLASAAADPTAATVPRVALVLLGVAPRLDSEIAGKVRNLAVPALELAEEWVRVGFPAADGLAVLVRVLTRLIGSAADAATAAHAPDVLAGVLRFLADAAPPPGSAARAALAPVAADFFRAVRKLGLGADARELLSRIPPSSPVGPLDLGLAAGWYATGNDDAGLRILNAARDRLFAPGPADERDRTAVAVGYAAALGHAPPRTALGRLEELFQRLDGIATRGATNRYYTLQPLELIAAAVRSVAGDEFAVGPAVRGWLDDDEFRTRRRIARDLDFVMRSSERGTRSEDPTP